ncbi:MAG: DivIVA domain-containing protein [Oscillospiraceae bacterium]|jgi:cell division initiation protein|nr:DivIVA domain-containing protein [Oscillospiraceae bacterium]
MLSLNDIINVGFRKSGFSGYRIDDVDAFLDRVRESYDELLKKGVSQDEEIEKLKAENQKSQDKIKVLADKIEEYRNQEDEIKNALISAQKLSDASVREARHKAEIIVKDANLQADQIVSGANEKIVEQKREMERLQQAVSDFRSKLLNTYKEHLTLINALPVHKPKPVSSAPQKPSAAPEQRPQPEPSAAATPAPAPEDPFQAQISNFEDEPSAL